jgi:hypothetical protein
MEEERCPFQGEPEEGARRGEDDAHQATPPVA